jgi:hypothetical protein
MPLKKEKRPPFIVHFTNPGYTVLVDRDFKDDFDTMDLLETHFYSLFGTYTVDEMRFNFSLSMFDTQALTIIRNNKNLAQYADKIQALIVENHKRAAANYEKGEIEFGDVPLLLTEGTRIVMAFEGQSCGGIVKAVTMIRPIFTREYLKVDLQVIHGCSTNGRPNYGLQEVGITSFSGRVPVADLPFTILKDDSKLMEFLTARGKLFKTLTSGEPQHRMYTGEMYLATYYSVQTHNASGRIMVDAGTFKRTMPDRLNTDLRTIGLSLETDRNDSEDRQKPVDIPDDRLWMTYPFVYGFSFKHKRWGRLAVGNITDIVWREDSYDKLVLEPTIKKMILSLTKSSLGTTSIVEGKGMGRIFLLHGPPGEGKTLTAETVAESLKKPLYSVTTGELGTDPTTLEKKLNDVLTIASNWKAVILIDEADIFLERRDDHNIIRNAMVGVFLRLLEYHQGTLFLTTNRVVSIDEAFYSRVSLGLHYKASDPTKRAKVWTNLLTMNGIPLENVSVENLSQHELNGRNITNVLNISIALAKTDGVELNDEIIESVIEITSDFAKHLKTHAAKAKKPTTEIERE